MCHGIHPQTTEFPGQPVVETSQYQNSGEQQSIIQEVIKELSISGATPLVYAPWNKNKVGNNPFKNT